MLWHIIVDIIYQEVILLVNSDYDLRCNQNSLNRSNHIVMIYSEFEIVELSDKKVVVIAS